MPAAGAASAPPARTGSRLSPRTTAAVPPAQPHRCPALWRRSLLARASARRAGRWLCSVAARDDQDPALRVKCGVLAFLRGCPVGGLVRDYSGDPDRAPVGEWPGVQGITGR